MTFSNATRYLIPNKIHFSNFFVFTLCTNYQVRQSIQNGWAVFQMVGSAAFFAVYPNAHSKRSWSTITPIIGVIGSKKPPALVPLKTIITPIIDVSGCNNKSQHCCQWTPSLESANTIITPNIVPVSPIK